MSHYDLDALAKTFHAYVKSDGPGFRRAARILQSIWRQDRGLPMGRHAGEPMGSRLPRTLAERTLSNFLTPTIRAVVREELAASRGQLYSEPRIYTDLLSSQPLCFNLFAELKNDLGLATNVLRILRPRLVDSVTNIAFEHSPARKDDRYTGDKSAFDVFIEYTTTKARTAFIGIEVKYHEDMRVPPAAHRKRYDDIAEEMKCFKSNALKTLHTSPLQQIWRDHLLAGAIREDGYAEGLFVVLYPSSNVFCRNAVRTYRDCLTDQSTFDVWTLEEIVGILTFLTPADWVREFRTRYIDFDQLKTSRL